METTVLSIAAIVLLVAFVRRGNEIDRREKLCSYYLTNRDEWIARAGRDAIEIKQLREDNARLSAAYQSEAAIVRRIRDLMNDTKGVE